MFFNEYHIIIKPEVYFEKSGRIQRPELKIAEAYVPLGSPTTFSLLPPSFRRSSLAPPSSLSWSCAFSCLLSSSLFARESRVSGKSFVDAGARLPWRRRWAGLRSSRPSPLSHRSQFGRIRFPARRARRTWQAAPQRGWPRLELSHLPLMRHVLRTPVAQIGLGCGLRSCTLAPGRGPFPPPFLFSLPSLPLARANSDAGRRALPVQRTTRLFLSQDFDTKSERRIGHRVRGRTPVEGPDGAWRRTSQGSPAASESFTCCAASESEERSCARVVPLPRLGQLRSWRRRGRG